MKPVCKYLVSLFLVTGVAFFLITSAPGKSADFERLQKLQSPQVEKTEAEHDGFIYAKWLASWFLAEWGESQRYNTSVAALVGEHLFPTAFQVIPALFISLLLLYFLGYFIYVQQFSRIMGFIATLLSSLPVVIVAILLQVLLASKWGLDWLPLQGAPLENGAGFWLWSKHSVLPVMVYVATTVPFLFYLLKGLVADEKDKEYLRSAIAKGLSPFEVYSRHLVVNLQSALLSVLPQTLYFLLMSTVLIEFLFNTPGLGQLLYGALLSRDVPLLMTLVTLQFHLVFFARWLCRWAEPQGGQR